MFRLLLLLLCQIDRRIGDIWCRKTSNFRSVDSVIVAWLQVTSPYGNNIHFGDNVDSGNFAFTSVEAGDYLACFWTPDHKPPVTVTVDFDWRTGVAAKDWPSVAKKGQIDVYFLFPIFFVSYFLFFSFGFFIFLVLIQRKS